MSAAHYEQGSCTKKTERKYDISGLLGSNGNLDLIDEQQNVL